MNNYVYKELYGILCRKIVFINNVYLT